MFAEESVFKAYPYRRRHVFVDVGANVGTFVEIFAKLGGQTIAFEPHPALFADLERRFGHDPRVVCIQRAISDKPGNLPFYTSREHPGIHSLAPFHATHEPTATVAVSTLRSELAARDVSDVTALKIDVEGADFLALRGVDWDKTRPELVMVEFMDDRSSSHFGYTHHDMASFMQLQGYETWVSEWAPLVEYGSADAGSPHTWMGFHAYDANRSPAHGNLLFVEPADSQRLQNVVRRVSRQATARAVVASIPGTRRALRTSRTVLRRRVSSRPKGRFVPLIAGYANRYQLTAADRVKLLAHYPLFKLAWLADARDDLVGRVAAAILRPAGDYAVWHWVNSTDGRLAVAAPVDPSGFASFAEIFLHDEYELADDRISIDTLVDLGGNIGMAALYLMSHFPIRRALIVEANPPLARTISRRLASVSATVAIENAAVVGHTSPTGIAFRIAANHRLSSVDRHDGRRITVPAYSLSDLLDRHGILDADLLKMDIEGSEFEILREDSGALLRFRYILVEVHGAPDSRRQFLAGLANLGFEVSVRTETEAALVAFASQKRPNHIPSDELEKSTVA